MSALTKKLFRDLWHHRGQMLSIGAVVATAIMTVLTMRGTYESLLHARDSYYQESRFPDLWANLERAPESIRAQIERIPGVTAVDTRVTFTSTLDIEGQISPATGQFVSISDRDRMLGALHVRSGRWITDQDRDQVLLSEKFALANEFVEGDTVRAIVNGRLKLLEVVGIAISPEHSYVVPAGSLFPDDESFGLFWMNRRSVAAAYDMEGGFNEVVLTLGPKADIDAVQQELDWILEPYGGLGSYRRETQLSHQFLESELNQNRTMGTAIPAIFLAVVAFLLNIVLRRLIATQRQEIAVLKAFGYSNLDVGLFYLRFALVAVLLGALVGVATGIWLGGVMVELYADYFLFPDLAYRASAGLILVAFTISVFAATAGALGGVREAISLPPAEAMRPKPPARFRMGFLERFTFAHRIPAAVRMIFRNIERQPLKSVFSALGVSFSVAILVIGMFMFDGVDYMMHLQFRIAQREDLAISFNRSLPDRVEYELASMPKITKAEMFRAVPARLIKGHLERETGIIGRMPGDELNRIVDEDGSIINIPVEGLVISAILAENLKISLGDRIRVDVLEGARRSETIRVTAIVKDFMGMSAYMHLETLHKLVRGPRMVSGANLAILDKDQSRESLRLGKLPYVASVSSPQKGYDLFQEQMSEGLFIGVFFLVGFSSIIALSVIYNGARVALSERGRELASLRVLGFSKREVAVLLFSEQGIITLLAIPIGWYLGFLFSKLIALSLVTETYRIPLIVDSGTYLFSAVVTIVAAIGSSLIVRKRLNNYDLISVLKTRD